MILPTDPPCSESGTLACLTCNNAATEEDCHRDGLVLPCSSTIINVSLKKIIYIKMYTLLSCLYHWARCLVFIVSIYYIHFIWLSHYLIHCGPEILASTWRFYQWQVLLCSTDNYIYIICIPYFLYILVYIHVIITLPVNMFQTYSRNVNLQPMSIAKLVTWR